MNYPQFVAHSDAFDKGYYGGGQETAKVEGTLQGTITQYAWIQHVGSFCLELQCLILIYW